MFFPSSLLFEVAQSVSADWPLKFEWFVHNFGWAISALKLLLSLIEILLRIMLSYPAIFCTSGK
jgi:hypothetical protein